MRVASPFVQRIATGHGARGRWCACSISNLALRIGNLEIGPWSWTLPFLPIAERELRVAARQGRTYRGRSGMALAALLVSSLSRDSRKASSGTLLFVLSLNFGLPMLAYLDTELIRKVSSAEAHLWLVLPSPTVSFLLAHGLHAIFR